MNYPKLQGTLETNIVRNLIMSPVGKFLQMLKHGIGVTLSKDISLKLLELLRFSYHFLSKAVFWTIRNKQNHMGTALFVTEQI
jgi:hypothetical protein